MLKLRGKNLRTALTQYTPDITTHTQVTPFPIYMKLTITKIILLNCLYNIYPPNLVCLSRYQETPVALIMGTMITKAENLLSDHLQHYHKFDHLMPLDQENIPIHLIASRNYTKHYIF